MLLKKQRDRNVNNLVDVGIIGAAGYTGSELLRLLLFHPEAEVKVITSRRYQGEYVQRVHPNLRGISRLKFSGVNLSKIGDECDFVFTAVPHGISKDITPELLDMGVKILDMSADFRLKNPELYPVYYDYEHPRIDLLEKSAYGIPEINREEIKNADLVACPGCLATSGIFGLAPIVKYEAFNLENIIVDTKIGSSAAGDSPSSSSHHPERSGVVRAYKPTNHRHTVEIEQELSKIAKKPVKIALSNHAVDIVRGILATIHVWLSDDQPIAEKDIWQMFREFYQNEYFVRLVRDRKGIYRFPDPKVIVGTNFCDLGFELDVHLPRLVILSAIDNLMKGASGSAVQSFNVMLGIDEKTGLDFPGFHPI